MTTEDKDPPLCVATEQKILGLAVAYARSGNFRCLDVQPSDFYFAAHDAIFKAIDSVYTNRGRLDAATIADEVRTAGGPWSDHARQALDDVTRDVFAEADAWQSGGFATEMATMDAFMKLVALRQTIQFATDLLRACYDQDKDTDLRHFMQPYADRFDKIAQEVGVCLDASIR